MADVKDLRGLAFATVSMGDGVLKLSRDCETQRAEKLFNSHTLQTATDVLEKETTLAGKVYYRVVGLAKLSDLFLPTTFVCLRQYYAVVLDNLNVG